MKRNLVHLILMILLLGGCTMAPNYTRPEAPVPAQWPAGTSEKKSDASVSAAADLRWQEFITDERLRKVIAIALTNNRDLRVAALNVESARAMYGIQLTTLPPAVDLSGGLVKTLVPADLSTTGAIMTSSQYSVNLGIISWEIDFFGRIRSLKDQALEQYLATDQARRSTQILLISSVAGAYLALAADKETLKLATATLETQETYYKLIKRRYDVGISSELDLQMAQSQVEAARGDLIRYTQLVALDENALNLLVGSSLAPELLPAELGSVNPPKEVSPGLSSEVLLQRPDVLAAEHNLLAANANIGAARAAFFPSITLTSLIGYASFDLYGLFKGGQGTWTFAPQIIMPIFDARTWYAYDVTKVEKEISIAQYEKAIQTAFREVADALAVRGTVDKQITAQQSLVDAVAKTYRLSQARYTKGIDSYLSVLDAQRSLYSAEQGLIALRLARIVNTFTLYKVLGGGE
jgi:multidrug efflux system outer membrane protein